MNERLKGGTKENVDIFDYYHLIFMAVTVLISLDHKKRRSIHKRSYVSGQLPSAAPMEWFNN